MYSKFTLFVILLLIIFLAKGVWGLYQREKLSRDNLLVSKKNYDELVLRKEYLEKKIERLNTEEGVEEEIRDKYSVVKPGEIAVVIVDDTTSTKSKVGQVEDKNWWQKIFGR